MLLFHENINHISVIIWNVVQGAVLFSGDIDIYIYIFAWGFQFMMTECSYVVHGLYHLVNHLRMKHPFHKQITMLPFFCWGNSSGPCFLAGCTVYELSFQVVTFGRVECWWKDCVDVLMAIVVRAGGMSLFWSFCTSVFFLLWFVKCFLVGSPSFSAIFLNQLLNVWIYSNWLNGNE